MTNREKLKIYEKGVIEGQKHSKPSPLTQKYMEQTTKTIGKIEVGLAEIRKDIKYLVEEFKDEKVERIRKIKETEEKFSDHITEYERARTEFKNWAKSHFASKDIEIEFMGIKKGVMGKFWKVVYFIAGVQIIEAIASNKDLLINIL